MKSILLKILMLSLVSVLCTPLRAQEPQLSEARVKLEKFEASIITVIEHIENKNDPFQLVEEQRVQLLRLHEAREQMIDQIQSLGNGTGELEAKMALFATKVSLLNDTLHEKILIPSQSEKVTSLVFKKIVENFDGNLIRALTTYYSQEFRLSEQQKEKLTEIQKQTAEKIRIAKKKFEKELREIESNCLAQTNKVLSKEQENLLKKMQSGAD